MNKYSKFITENLLIIFLSILIIPFLYLSFFNHPSSDDWIVADIVDQHGLINSQAVFYLTWSGRYFSNILVSITPVYFHSFLGYKIVTFLIMSSFIYVLFLFVSELTKKALSVKESLLLTLSIFFLYLYSMPTVSQAFYWMNGAVPYQIGLMLVMMFLTLYSKITDPENSESLKSLTVKTVIVIILASGCSEMAMTLVVFSIGLIVLSKLITERKLNSRIILFTVTSAVCSAIMFTAPGNGVRGTVYPNSHQLIPTLKISISSMLDYMISWIFFSPLVFLTIVLIPILYKIVKDSGKNPVKLFLNPLYTIPVFLIFLYALFFIPVWSVGGVPFNRTVNIIYFVFLIGWFYNVSVLIYLLSEKFSFTLDRIPKYVYTIALVLVVVFLFKKNNVKNAYSDILKGRAAKYDKEQFARYDFINNSSADTLLLPNIVNKPSTVFICDITPDKGYHLNYMFAHHFGKKTMYIIENDSLKNEK